MASFQERNHNVIVCGREYFYKISQMYKACTYLKPIIIFPIVIDCDGLTYPNEGQVIIIPCSIPVTLTGLDAEASYTCNAGYNLVGDVMCACPTNS